MNLGLDSNPLLLRKNFPKFNFIYFYFSANWIFPIPVVNWRVRGEEDARKSGMKCKFKSRKEGLVW